MAKKRKTARPTDYRRWYLVNFVLSGALIVAGLALMAGGIWIWQIEKPEGGKLVAGRSMTLPQTHSWDTGLTLYAEVPDPKNVTPPIMFGCTVSGSGATRTADTVPDRSVAGSRVPEGRSLVAVVDLGQTRAGDQLQCKGSAVSSREQLWVLPTDLDPSERPLATTVLGVFVLGVGSLLHPRLRRPKP